MSGNLIAIIVLLGSLLGMGIILYRKMPIFAELSKETAEEKENLFPRLNLDIIKRFFPVKSFSLEGFLHKILSKIRVLALKIENKTATLLEKLRTKKREEKEGAVDNFWAELKNSKDAKKKTTHTKVK